MTFGLSCRVAVCCSAAWLAGALAFTPSPAAARTGADVSTASAGAEPLVPRPAASRPTGLYRSGTQVRLSARVPKVPAKLSARSWLVADAGTGEVLAAHNAHRKLPPASTLKALFAVTVLPALPAAVQHTVKARELKGIGAGSSLVGVEAGRTYRASDLWRGVFLNSGNDAVRVLAAMNGGWRATAAQMQAKARSLGARDTRVVSPDGYDTPGQVSSAYDLAVFGRAGLRNADFARYCATVTAKFPGKGRSYVIRNTNRLLTGADGVKPYRGLIGIKNGYTSKAGNTLVAAARRDGRTLVVTVMNPRTGGGLAVYEEARSLLDWGFEAAGRVKPVGSLVPSRAVPQAGPAPAPAAMVVADGSDRWAAAGAISGAACLGAGVVAVVLRGRRFTRV
ncbi:D-alanyl-D-alanine carboxypeptidase [Streptomyces sp. YC419]|uniref:D-alanyl-D-alanine carboxypeptidase n=1 Tax=Streptomyces ureilyticus TaxID=1775131 RepID=A0ABX0DIE4_9ACTN|nr:D-alanyl-D-alanine carboxypeptidase [Streptomyces ureilyticus]